MSNSILIGLDPKKKKKCFKPLVYGQKKERKICIERNIWDVNENLM